jgi:hypothetical protein
MTADILSRLAAATGTSAVSEIRIRVAGSRYRTKGGESLS